MAKPEPFDITTSLNLFDPDTDLSNFSRSSLILAIKSYQQSNIRLRAELEDLREKVSVKQNSKAPVFGKVIRFIPES